MTEKVAPQGGFEPTPVIITAGCAPCAVGMASIVSRRPCLRDTGMRRSSLGGLDAARPSGARLLSPDVLGELSGRDCLLQIGYPLICLA